ncbi:MAG: DegV family protein [Clostridia bacterium]|nr:DegV family protein [Clostridia bacterium]
MSVIFTDTDCELWYDKVEEIGVKMISMPYLVNGEERMADCGEGTDFREFYDNLRAKVQITTAALNSENYKEIFEPYFAQGEEILYISFSTQMSGTFNYMQTAIDELSAKYPDARFVRFDTKSICLGAGLQVYLAVKYFNEGHTIDETVKFLEELSPKACTAFIVNDLYHLARGGRLSTVAATFGSLLDLKPFIKVDDEGKLSVVKKCRGRKLAINELLKYITDNIAEPNKYPIVVVNADCPNDSDLLVSKIKQQYPDAEIWTQIIGPVIAAHCGPDTLGVVFIGNNR